MVNSTLKSVLTIWKTISLKFQSSNLIQLSPIRNVWLLNHLNQLWPNLKTNTTDLPVLLAHFTKISQTLSKTVKSMPLKISKPEVRDWLKNSAGKRTMLPRFGVSVQKTLAPTWLSMLLRESNIWMKSKNQWFHLSKTLPNKVFSVNKTWEVWDSTLLIVNSTLMPSTEEEDKLCQLPEDSIMLLKCSVNQLYLNQSSVVKSLLQWIVWVVSINHSTPEEVKSLKKHKSWVPHLTL